MNELTRPMTRPITRPGTRPGTGLMTREAFIARDAPGPCRWQLIDGEAVAMVPASRRHGAIQAELSRLLGNHFVQTGSDCHVIVEPGIVPTRSPDMNYRVPGIAVTREPDWGDHVVSQPVLVVEVLSPSNEAQTRANVDVLKTIPSLREILVVQSTRVEAELHRRAADGRWPAPDLVPAGSMLTLASVGLAVALTALYLGTSLQQSTLQG